MSLASNLTAAFTRVGTEFKTVYGKIGDLSTLSTTAKGSLVAALNEVKASSGAGVAINDTTPSTTSVYSSSKTNTAISTAVSNLVAASPATLDTLKELADALGDDPNYAATTATALGQRPTTTQVGDTTTDFTGAFVTALTS